MNKKELKPILFTRTELDYLIGKLEANGDYSRVLEYRISKKLIEFERLIWPILKSNPLTQSWVHAFIGKIVTAGSNGVTISYNAKEEGLNGPKPLIVNEVEWARQDSNLRPSLCKSDVLTMLDYWP